MGLMDLFRRSKSLTLEEQLAHLGRAGIHLKAEFNVETLLESWDRAQYEKTPYELTLLRLGGELEREPWTPLSDQVWDFDTECIEDNGAYILIAERVRTLADGALPISNLQDEIDVENGVARLSFTLDGSNHGWELEVDNDWADTKIFERFQQLLSRTSDKRLAYYDTGGQDIILVCFTPEKLRQLEQLTGLDFHIFP